MRNWYSPVSSSEIVVSVAVMVVFSVVWRGSLGALVHRVFHEWSAAACVARVTPGSGSQHSFVRNVRPSPVITSSPFSSRTVTCPPGCSCAAGRGPHALPQSPMFHRSVRGAAFHTPASVGRSAAKLGRAESQTSAHTAAMSENEYGGIFGGRDTWMGRA